MRFTPPNTGDNIEESLRLSRSALKRKIDRAVPGIWTEHKFTPVERVAATGITVAFAILRIVLCVLGIILLYKLHKHFL